jgi:ribose/xylose/arabinose/galactoside ABC-type transport system permease subunit
MQSVEQGSKASSLLEEETPSWLSNKKELLWGQMPFFALIVLCLVASLMSDRFLSPININNILVQGAVMTVIAVGMTFVIIGGGFDLSVGSTAAMSGIVAAWVMLESNIVFGLIAGVGVGALIGFVNGLIITKLDVNPFIATLGTMVLVRGLTFVVTDGQPVMGEEGLPQLFLDFALNRFLGIPYLVWLPLIIVIIFTWLLHHTAYGIRVFATGGNTEAAFLSGINVSRIRASTYVWCGTLAGLGGVMLASRLQSGQPTAGGFYELTAIAAVVLGGASLYGGEGKLYKSVIGVFIMIVLANALNLANVPSHWQQVAVGVVIVVAAAADRWRHR